MITLRDISRPFQFIIGNLDQGLLISISPTPREQRNFFFFFNSSTAGAKVANQCNLLVEVKLTPVYCRITHIFSLKIFAKKFLFLILQLS